MENFNYPNDALWMTLPAFLSVTVALIGMLAANKMRVTEDIDKIFYFTSLLTIVFILALIIVPCASKGSLPFVFYTSAVAVGFSATISMEKKGAKIIHLTFTFFASLFVLIDAVDNSMAAWIITFSAILSVLVFAHWLLLIVKYNQKEASRVFADVVWFLFFFLIVTGYILGAVNPRDPAEVGTVVASAGQSGAGPEKRSVTFYFYEDDGSWMPFRNWDTLDPDEKIRVKAKFKGTDAVKEEPIKGGPKEDYVYMGIEGKGKLRHVPNLNMECMQRSDDDVHDYGGEDCQLFSHFEEKYEDWWLVMGGPADVTHYRQMFANELFGVPYVVLDVFTQHNSTVKTYEGVGLLLPAFKKDLYADLFGEERKGKIKCDDDGSIKDENGPALMKYEEGDANDNFFAREFTTRVFTDSSWEAVYPKETKLEETCLPDNKNKLLEKYNHRIIELASVNTTAELKKFPIDTKDFAKSWIWEMLLQDTDFAFRSQNFALYDPIERDDEPSPKSSLILGPNFLWDYNAAGYRGRDFDEGFFIYNMYPSFGWENPVPIFKTFCLNSISILQEHTSTVNEVLTKATAAANKVNSILTNVDMQSSLEYAFTNRNDRGKKRVGDALDTHIGDFANYFFKKTAAEETKYQHDKMLKRIDYVSKHWQSVGCEIDKKMGSVKVILTILFIIFYFLFAIGSLCERGTVYKEYKKQNLYYEEGF